MKILVTIFAALNGLFMLIDGVYVVLNGKYIGPEKPGPWAQLLSQFNIDVFKLGPLFIMYGLLWLIWIYGVWTHQSWAYTFGIFLCLVTLWYLPFGTMLSLGILFTLLFARGKVGL